MMRWLPLLVRLDWPFRLLSPWIGLYNPFTRVWRRDPYPHYRALREQSPVYRSRGFRLLVASSYEECLGLLKDPRFSVRRSESRFFQRDNPFASLSPEFQEMIWRNLLMLDPPDHTRLRNLVNKAFTPRVVEELRPRIQRIVDELLDEAARRDDVDLVRDFAYPLPVIVIAEMLGLPSEDRAQFKEWADDLVALLDPLSALSGLEKADASYWKMSRYFREVIAKRRVEPRDDLISRLVAAEEEGDALTEVEMISTCGLILGAGHETTTKLIGNGVLALLRNPDERRRLQEDPELIGSAVEEFLRYDSPVQATDRMALEDCELGGQRIEKGELAVVLLGAANRDPARFADPDRLDLGRRDNRHLAFGQGVHFCLGAQLARAEAQIAIQTLLERHPRFEGERDPELALSITLRGPVSLPISLG